ncbi:HvfC/BufC N-terminal domain-containing protein [Vibrio ulleungensis]|uniref:DNA-binding domain-containing protein n=1 Tax=Vibrio ulleungensis TaxID=2807619 RepID=A0ABS2HMB6_9VIBR|nr:DNA-binding domain-containing protein [Vibrio ulleungensis]MBM7038625.1 putative DNA-binding domain-containing protein [Vibrio ulleungensis]
MRLADIQANFSHALLDTENRFEVEFHCGIVSDQFRAADRLQIYKNNVMFSLVDVLAACYPLTKAIVGDLAFEQLAKRSIREHPPTQADTSQYGKHFCHTVAKVSSVIETVPYILEVIRFEWHGDRLRHQVYDGNTPLCVIQTFGQLPPEKQQQAKIQLAETVALFESDWAVVDIHNAIKTDNYEDLNLNAHQCVVIAREGKQLTSTVVDERIYRVLQTMRQRVAITSLSPEQLTLLPTFIANAWITHYSY